MKKNIIDTLIPAVSLEVIRFNASEILNDKEPALRALMTDKSVIVNSPTEAFEIAEKAVLAVHSMDDPNLITGIAPTPGLANPK